MKVETRTLNTDVAMNGTQLRGHRQRHRNRNVFDNVRDIVYEPRVWQIAETLVKSNAYYVNMSLAVTDWFKWRSGIKAPCYCDCRHLNSNPKARFQITEALTEAVRDWFPDAALIVGMATAGLPWARAIADNLHLPLAYVRSSSKQHGVGGLVECSPGTSDKAVLIDDLVASGDSLKAAIKALADEANIHAMGIQTIVNWGFPAMRKKLSGTPVKTLTSFPYILTLALQQGRINDEDLVELMAFYQNPQTHVWGHLFPKWGKEMGT